MRCNDCMYFDRIEWVGANEWVVCRHPFFVPNGNVTSDKGCPFGNRTPAESRKNKKQLELF